ncbi:MAG: trehalose-phosphatase [Omnitrophica bacterium RBG_13_46_9]|nr:MAG: trehalose-phosphatase [Omnitrophica bacterium RBG_13_46_9]
MGREILRRVEKDIEYLIKEAKKIVFFLDYDGTLTPIRREPDLARIDTDTKNLLIELARSGWCKIFVISGRSLENIAHIVNISSLYYIGNHGIELKGPGLNYVNRQARDLKPYIQKCYKALNKRFAPPAAEGIKGVIVENKTYTLSIHYRLAKPEKIPVIKRAYRDAIKDFLKKKKIRVTEGKKVFEIRPNIRWDKGKIVDWVIRKVKTKNILPICIGDDKTDEDVFRALGRKGISILVSDVRRKTSAQYRLSSTGEVKKFLEFVLTLRRRQSL